ncbi:MULTISPECIES: pseudouridine synthase [unclassified Moraxella]|uniref:pseudouridine synthase n=1 Tax=unclassified Moraxella TaxID=2685852 RepID=UPI00359D2C87
MEKLVLFNKPYGVHSQFRKEHDQMQTLADFFDDKSLRVAGRLDKDSEGLLILTNSGGINHAITTPMHKGGEKKFGKTYLVQVENNPTAEQIAQLEQGVVLKDGRTLPCQVRLLDELPINLWERNPPIRERKAIPTAWLSITIYEGKNRQVRRMVAHVGLPCLRLIRYQIGVWSLAWGGCQLGVGESYEITMDKQTMARLGLSTLDNGSSNPKNKPSGRIKHKKRVTASHKRHKTNKGAYSSKPLKPSALS